MGNIKQIGVVFAVSALLIGGIGWWINTNGMSTMSEESQEAALAQNDALPEDKADSETISASDVESSMDTDNTNSTMNRVAQFTTSMGVIEIELFEDTMPITTANFIKLAEEKFYDGIKFHRVIDGFMIQAGDPNTKGDTVSSYGTGGPGYTIQDEFVEGPLLSNVRGTIAMANTGQPNSGGSQFFINTVDNTGLDFDKEPFTSRHPVFGRVVKGMDIVDAIAKVETGARDLPIEPVVIESVTILDGE